MQTMILILTANRREGYLYQKRTGLHPRNCRIVMRKGQIAGLRKAIVHELPSFKTFVGRHGVLEGLRHVNTEWHEVAMPEKKPVDQGDGMGEQLDLFAGPLPGFDITPHFDKVHHMGRLVPAGDGEAKFAPFEKTDLTGFKAVVDEAVADCEAVLNFENEGGIVTERDILEVTPGSEESRTGARPPTPAEQVVARLDSYTQEEHVANIEAARERVKQRKRRGRCPACGELTWTPETCCIDDSTPMSAEVPTDPGRPVFFGEE